MSNSRVEEIAVLVPLFRDKSELDNRLSGKPKNQIEQ